MAATFLSLQKPGVALPHLLKAIELNAQNEVAWYRLAQVQKELNNTAEQQKTLAEYRRLHDKANQPGGLDPAFSPREVTKQQIGPNAQ